MTDPNPYSPPRASVAEPRGVRAWFQRRPIPVFVIAALCLFQCVTILVELGRHWDGYLGLVQSDAMSPLAFGVGLLGPLGLAAAGLALLCRLDRVAAGLFVAYFVWAGARLVTTGRPVDALSLALIFGCLVYSLRLASRGTPRQD